MKLIKKNISAKDGEGSVTLCANDSEDMWHAYNLIMAGDIVTATTIRKVVKENATAVQSQRMRLTLAIKISTIDFDPQECSIRVGGKNMRENPHVKLGAHHTIELEPHRNFTIEKERWDTIFLERLDTACNPLKQAKVAAVVMEQGLAHVCLITGHMTLLRSKIEKSIPKKRAAGKSHDDAMKKFFEQVLQAMLREIDFNIVKVVILASPGYVKDDFFKFLLAEGEKRNDVRVLSQNKDQFLLAHSSSGYKHALDQILSDPGLQDKLLDTQAVKEVKALNKFFKMLNESSEKAFYSYPHVQAALERGAIDSLLVTDSLFRSSDIRTRKKYVKLVEDCREAGAKVFIFSALHPSGEQLEQLSGVAAILRYPLPDLDDLEITEQVEETDEGEDLDYLQDEEDLSSEEEDNAVSTQAAHDAGLHHLTHDEEDTEDVVNDLFAP